MGIHGVNKGKHQVNMALTCITDKKIKSLSNFQIACYT